MDVPEWLASKIVINDNGCWIWQGQRQKNGYGRMFIGSRQEPDKQWYMVAHKAIYLRLVGPYDESLDLDHLCHTKACPGGPTCPHRPCVNPEHLGPDTRSANCLRGHTGAGQKVSA